MKYMNRFLDLRFVIGLFFFLTGCLLLAYQFFHGEGSLNLWCGALFALFGLMMMLFSKKEREG